MESCISCGSNNTSSQLQVTENHGDLEFDGRGNVTGFNRGITTDTVVFKCNECGKPGAATKVLS